jgi:anti-sigma factor RsiW
MTEPTTCRDVVELLSDYLDGALPPGEAAHVRAHLDGCVGCGTALAQLRETVARTGTLTEDAIGAAQRELLLSAFRDRHAEG